MTTIDVPGTQTHSTQPAQGGEGVSIVIPTYNRASLIERSLRSVLVASEPQDEIIVIDDGSTDDTEAVVARFGEHVRYVRVPNGGCGSARNHGIRLASRPLLAFQDSDDEWFPEKLRLQRALMAARPDLVFTFSDFTLRDDQGREFRNHLAHWPGCSRPLSEWLPAAHAYSSVAPLPPSVSDFTVRIGDMYPALLEGAYVAVQSILIRRELAGDALRSAEDLAICEDWYATARLARCGPAAFLERETFWNYGHAGPRMTSDASHLQLLTKRLEMLERVWGSDRAFLARGDGSARYAEIVRELRLERAQWLLSRGRVAEARADLRHVRHAPMLLRGLAALPAPIARLLGNVRRALLLARQGKLTPEAA